MKSNETIQVGLHDSDRESLLKEALGHASCGPTSRPRKRGRLPCDMNLPVEAIEGSMPVPPDTGSVSHSLTDRLRVLARQSDCLQAEFIELLAQFDLAIATRTSGISDCVLWMVSELGFSRSLAFEKLRVARALRNLPLVAAHFGKAELSWSKVRALTRVATPKDEPSLVAMALKHDANDVLKLCDDYRWGKHDQLAEDDKEEADRQRFERRSVTLTPVPDGSIALKVVLPPDMAANLLRCLEHTEELLFDWNTPKVPETSLGAGDNETPSQALADRGIESRTDEQQRIENTALRQAEKFTEPTAPQRRADALVAMGEASLTGNSDGATSAERFQVVIHVDAEVLEDAIDVVARDSESADRSPPDDDYASRSDLPLPLPLPLRASIAGIAGGSISPSTARRMACDGSLLTMILKHGEPIAVGRKTRTWNAATRRAILARDGSCIFPGCGSTRNLDIHHVHEWAFGGETSVSTGASLCRRCHTRVHDEGWKITRIPDQPRMSGNTLADNPADGALVTEADSRTGKLSRVLDARGRIFRFQRDERK